MKASSEGCSARTAQAVLRRLFYSGCTGKQLENLEQRRDMSLVYICGKIALPLCRGQSRC